MARLKTLVPLKKTLLARSADLRKKLANDLALLRDFKAADSTGDSADVAFEANSDEIASQLAELDARVLNQIERALARLKQGMYGICEGGGKNCQIRIPLPRLQALPYTTLCINCERELEQHSDWPGRRRTGNWAQVFDWEAPMERQRINLSTWESDVSTQR